MQLLDKYAKVLGRLQFVYLTFITSLKMTGICNETDIELGEAMEYRHSLINLCYYVSVTIFSRQIVSVTCMLYSVRLLNKKTLSCVTS